MHGAMKSGFFEARIVVSKRLSHIPARILAIISALAGAITIQSAHLERERCIDIPS
jgi:hypothetical protein